MQAQLSRTRGNHWVTKRVSGALWILEKRGPTSLKSSCSPGRGVALKNPGTRLCGMNHNGSTYRRSRGKRAYTYSWEADRPFTGRCFGTVTAPIGPAPVSTYMIGGKSGPASCSRRSINPSSPKWSTIAFNCSIFGASKARFRSQNGRLWNAANRFSSGWLRSITIL